jgi:hypothetical protein
MDLEEDIKDFTARDLKQYKELTLTVRDHCLKMLENKDMPEALCLAAQMSVEQAERDLDVLSKAMEERKAKIGEAAFQEELSAPTNNADSGHLDSESEDDDDS